MAKKEIKKQSDQRLFTLVYDDFLDCKTLSTCEKMVFIALKRFTNSKNKCFPSLSKLAEVTGICKRKVQDTLKELESKHIITSEKRARPDGGKSSNLYILHDTAAMWAAGTTEEMRIAAEESEIDRSIRILKEAGFQITKEKGLDSEPTKAHHQAPQKTNNNDTRNQMKSQENVERYSMADIRELFCYSVLQIDYPQYLSDIDVVFNILYDTLNTRKEKIRINGEDKPLMTVISRLMKLDKDSIMYAVEKFGEQTERIKNPRAYMLTILYHAPEQFHLDIQNQVMHNMAKWESPNLDAN